MGDPSSLRLSLIPESTDAAGNGLTSPIATTVGRDGSFEFPAVIPGRYRIEAAAGAWWLRSAMQQGSDALDTGLEVALGEIVPVEAEDALSRTAPGEAIGKAMHQPVVERQHERRVDGLRRGYSRFVGRSAPRLFLVRHGETI